MQSFATTDKIVLTPSSTLNIDSDVQSSETVVTLGVTGFTIGPMDYRCCKRTDLEPFLTCLIQSKSMTPASDAPSVFELAPRTSLRWFLGTAAVQAKLRRLLVRKIASVANVAKRLARLTS
jgi:hypothetical protein